MEKNIYALTYCYEGYENSRPYASIVAISENIDKLREKMAECVKEDTREDDETYFLLDDENEWTDECNYMVEKICGDCVILRHRKYIGLYTKYTIQKVDTI